VIELLAAVCDQAAQRSGCDRQDDVVDGSAERTFDFLDFGELERDR
jgi:hypothetical protein